LGAPHQAVAKLDLQVPDVQRTATFFARFLDVRQGASRR